VYRLGRGAERDWEGGGEPCAYKERGLGATRNGLGRQKSNLLVGGQKKVGCAEGEHTMIIV